MSNKNISQDSSNAKANKIFEVVDSVDLSTLATKDVAVDLPNLYQLLLKLRAEITEAETKSINITVTNVDGEGFNVHDRYPPDSIFFDFFIRTKSLKINRVVLQTSSKAPYLNMISVCYNHPTSFPPDFELVDRIGGFNWFYVDRKLWPSYWTENVKLGYQVELF